ncbi:intermembrane phospholipid transport protein YdbH family protein [Tsuneonella sp. HG222]
MAEDEAIETAPGADEQARSGKRSPFWWRWFALPLVLILGLAILAFWIQRKDIADNVIAGAMVDKGVPATYEIERIGGTRQVLRNIVVGDPARPDLTVERAEVVIRYRLGFPAISSIRLVRPRLFGTLVDGKPSFGTLDPLIFTGGDEPFEFPDFALDLVDGRALLETDYGPVGIKAEGRGHLRSGFKGALAATAPNLALPGCRAVGTTLYGSVAIAAERPSFKGPLRLASLDCAESGVSLGTSALTADFRLDRDLKGVEGKLGGSASQVAALGAAVDELKIASDVTFRDGALTAAYDLAGAEVSHPQVRLASLAVDGTVRAGDGFDWIRAETEFEGTGLRQGQTLDATLAGAVRSAEGTFAASLLAKFRTALLRETAGSGVSGELSLRKTADALAVVVSSAQVRNRGGDTLLALSRLQYATSQRGLPRLSGFFATGGPDLPAIEGRIDRRGTDDFTAKLATARYAAGQASLAIPGLTLVTNGSRVGFAGNATISGDLPGGFARNLQLPLSGNWTSGGQLALWSSCTNLRFDALRLANLTLERRGLTLCPARGQPIVRYDGRGLRIGAGAPSLDLAGRLGETPMTIRSGPIGIAYPGAVSARQMLVTLGPPANATTFSISNLTADIGKTINGRFDGTDVRLYAVPLDLVDASGAWDYTGGVLSIGGGKFRLVDRQAAPRFDPLVAEGASLRLRDNLITADALLREPRTGRTVTQVDIRHSLQTGDGHADLLVPGILFDQDLQPAAADCAARPAGSPLPTGRGTPGLSCLMQGVIALAKGTVTGKGVIDWGAAGVTSSGEFSSDSLDFAAAFGPVRGASGTVVFTDLLGMTTAPNQRIKVAAINPGIEVYDGEIGIELHDGRVLALTGGTWPFMGGTLTMRPVTLNLGASEVRSYILEIAGLEAAQFVERMKLGNINATGVFDGTLPLVFDANGNGRIIGGRLTSRGPGNVSYVGALTYEDMGAMANFAFDALKSLDYQRMTLTVDGPLTGELITQVNIEGVRQGEGAKQNFITRRFANLPIRFVINVKAAFYQLLSNLKSLYDPAAVRDPRELGLIDAEGNALRTETEGPPPEPPVTPDDLIPDDATIQRRESEDMP